MPNGTITALRAQAHDSQRVNVFIDGEFALGVSLNTLTREGLYVGKVLDAEAWERLETAESADKALHAALRWLETRPRSAAELRERLQRKGFAANASDAAIARLTDLGLIDDAAFTRFWVENRLAYRPRGVRALRDELRRKGIARDVIEAALSDEEVTSDEPDRALTLARKALRKYSDVADKASFQRRMGGYLQRRGFGFDTIAPILDTLWNELQRDR